MNTLVPDALTAAAFAPFGEVIAADAAAQCLSINAGNTARYHDLARLDAGPDGRLIVSIFRGQPRTLPFTVQMMERQLDIADNFLCHSLLLMRVITQGYQSCCPV